MPNICVLLFTNQKENWSHENLLITQKYSVYVKHVRFLFISFMWSGSSDFFWAKMPPIFGGFPSRNFAFFSQFEVNFFPNYKN